MKSIKIIEWEAIDENGSKEFAAGLKDYLIPGATFLLYGDLGSGKTFLVREVAAVLNARNDVSSPSFALIHQYKADININHIDLYRIRNAKEITNLGLDEILNSDSINFIEWPQIIESSIQWTHFRIMIKNSPVYQSGRKYEVFKLW